MKQIINGNNILVKNNEKFSQKYGDNPYERSFETLLEKSVIVLDKHSGPTSHQSVDMFKKILDIAKAGHSGTLDPKVTGVLVVGLGKATRLMEYMLKSDKEYVCLMYIHKSLPEKLIRETILQFVGTIKQTPPIISAVKRQERERTIYKIDILEFSDENKSVLFRVSCQHGTYIRKLCSDIGEKLGVGAQMKELRRTKAGPFREENGIISLDNLRNLYNLYKKNKETSPKTNTTKNTTKNTITITNMNIYEKKLREHILPCEVALSDFKKVYLRDSCVDSICHGSDLAIPGVAKLDDNIEVGEEVAMLTQRGELVSMGISYLSSKAVMKKRKGAFLKTYKVFMDTCVYPTVWDFKKEFEKNKLKKNKNKPELK